MQYDFLRRNAVKNEREGTKNLKIKSLIIKIVCTFMVVWTIKVNVKKILPKCRHKIRYR